MKVFNFYKPTAESMDLLTYCFAAGFEYTEVSDLMRERHNIYLPKDQWEAYSKVLTIQADLDIGHRQSEVPSS